MFDLLAIDYGTKRIGLALGSTDTSMAVPHEVIGNDEKSIEFIKGVIADEEIQEIILGRPVALNQEETEMTQKVEKFKKELEASISIPIIFEDERMTSSMIEKVAKGLKSEQKGAIDAVSAMLILQGYMDRKQA